MVNDPQYSQEKKQYDETSGFVNEKQVKVKRSWSFGDSWFGFVFIFMGGLFLLNTFDIVPWAVWGQLWRFWPIILIFVGIKMLLGSSFFGNVLMLLFAGVIVFFLSLYVLAGSITEIGQWTSDNFNWLPQLQSDQGFIEKTTYSEQITKEDYPEINNIAFSLDSGAETFVLDDSDANNLFGIDAEYSTVFEAPSLIVDEDDDVLSIALATGESANVPFGLFGEANYELSFGMLKGVSTGLAIDMGSGSGTIKFENNTVQEVSIEMGSGSLEARFIGPGTPASLDIEMGSGNLEIMLDEDVDLEVMYNVGSGSLKIDDSSVSGSGTFRASNSDNERLVEITVSMGSGSLSIQRN